MKCFSLSVSPLLSKLGGLFIHTPLPQCSLPDSLWWPQGLPPVVLQSSKFFEVKNSTVYLFVLPGFLLENLAHNILLTRYKRNIISLASISEIKVSQEFMITPKRNKNGVCR
jgi:hypothetical protein